jgi:hypothetical protein
MLAVALDEEEFAVSAVLGSEETLLWALLEDDEAVISAATARGYRAR